MPIIISGIIAILMCLLSYSKISFLVMSQVIFNISHKNENFVPSLTLIQVMLSYLYQSLSSIDPFTYIGIGIGIVGVVAIYKYFFSPSPAPVDSVEAIRLQVIEQIEVINRETLNTVTKEIMARKTYHLSDTLDLLEVRLKLVWQAADVIYDKSFLIELEHQFFAKLAAEIQKNWNHGSRAQRRYWHTLMPKLNNKVDTCQIVFGTSLDEAGFYKSYKTMFVSAHAQAFPDLKLVLEFVTFCGSIAFYLSFFTLLLSIIKIFYSQPIMVEVVRHHFSESLRTYLLFFKHLYFNNVAYVAHVMSNVFSPFINRRKKLKSHYY
jgi:hypothetical protein